MRRILSVLLENESGALSRVIGLFSQRGYNIESLTVAPTDDPTLSRMTIQTVGDEKAIEQIEKQLHKLVDVLRVNELGQGAHVEREIMLVKVQASGYGRDEVKRNTEMFQQAMQMFSPFMSQPAPKESRKADAKDIDELKEQLKALQTKLDSL